MTKFEKIARITGGLMVALMGLALTAGLLDMGRHARWSDASLHDLASYGFSVLFGLAVAIGGILTIINPKTRGVRIW